MKRRVLQVTAMAVTAALTLSFAPIPAALADKAGITMTAEASMTVTDVPLTFSSTSLDWVVNAGQEPAKALDRNPATKWRTWKANNASGGLFVQFYGSQKFVPQYYTFTTADDAATQGGNPASWTLYGQSTNGQWVALDRRQNGGGMQNVNSAMYQFNIASSGTKYSVYRIEFTGLTGTYMQLADIRLYGYGFESATSANVIGNGTTHTITFNSQGGTSVSSQRVQDGKRGYEPSDPTRDGYKFDGWFTGRNGNGHYYDFSERVYEDTTLYANWVLKTADNDAALKKQKEEAEKKQKEAEEQKKAAEEAAKKAEEQKKAAEETAKKAEEERQKLEAEKKAAEEAAKKAEEERKALEAKKKEEEERQKELEEFLEIATFVEEINDGYQNGEITDEDLKDIETAINESMEGGESATVSGFGGFGAAAVAAVLAGAGGFFIGRKTRKKDEAEA